MYFDNSSAIRPNRNLGNGLWRKAFILFRSSLGIQPNLSCQSFSNYRFRRLASIRVQQIVFNLILGLSAFISNGNCLITTIYTIKANHSLIRYKSGYFRRCNSIITVNTCLNFRYPWLGCHSSIGIYIVYCKPN